MPTPTRDLPYAEVLVYKPGHGDPFLIDPGLAWYDVLGESYESGRPGVNAAGVSLLESLEGIGVCCRPFLFPKTTSLSQFTTSGGSWQTIYPDTGPRVTHLDQYDTANTATSWAATWSYVAPANPQVAFSLLLDETNSDWDWDTYPPFTRIELGGEWGIQFTKAGTFLARYVGGVWTAVKDLSTPPRNADGSAIWIYFRVLRGQIGVSFDFGQHYEWYAPPGAVAFVNAARIILRGRGSTATFGIHQLKTFAGTWDSQAKPLERPRLTATVSFTGSRYDTNGGTVGFTDLGAPVARLAQYRATLTPPTATPGTAFAWYFTPVLYAVNYRIAPGVEPGGTDDPEALPGDLLSVRIVKPVDLAGTSATITFTMDAYDDNDAKYYRNRKVEIHLGYTMTEGADPETYGPFYFYVSDQSADWSSELSKFVVTWNLLNISARFRRDPWSPFRQVALCGQPPNDAGSEIFYWVGLNASYYSWHAAGAAGLIPLGMAEEPCELCTAQEMPWETLERIMRERFLELAISDDGVCVPVPLNYVSAGDPFIIRATAPDLGEGEDERNTTKTLNYRTDYKESCTSVLVWCKDESGAMVFAGAVDTAAETNTASDRFSGWRETRLKELSGTASAGYVLGHAQAEAQAGFPLKSEADIAIPVDPRRSRRERVALYGFQGMGIPDATEFVLLTLEHTFTAMAGITELTTTGGLRRLDS